MKYAKKWISIDDQVDLLTRGKGLGCNNVDDLKRSLETIGYYRLSAYWFPYKTSSGDGKTVFREGTTFDEIMRTYVFDSRLRLLMFEAVARIEVFLRSRLAYFAAKEDGAFGYPDSARTKLSREYSAAKKSEQYIKHFANAYGDEHDLPPYWMMVECATMGTLELLFSKVSPSTRTAVASDLGVKVPVFKNWLSVLRVTRNACCHPFREGNGRTQRIFANQLARQAGWELNFKAVSPERLCEAYISSMVDMSDLIDLLNDTVSPKEN